MNVKELRERGYKVISTHRLKETGTTGTILECIKSFEEYRIVYTSRTNYFGGREDLYIHPLYPYLGKASPDEKPGVDGRRVTLPSLSFFATGFENIEAFEEFVKDEIWPHVKKWGIRTL